MNEALKIQLDEGRFTSAAKGYKDIAEVRRLVPFGCPRCSQRRIRNCSYPGVIR
jgi:transposase